ncbi:winged helix-turn-helix domain-containing protein [Paenibacillus glycinis]|uniref:OmpR/PhoB-type domain-containing protein n=1 Tax=Paenibacillus glycinis TaxID=2697035 RepID=A0ABW9XKC3_9BACL|nr:hypothetical protein [Paenibacillus glycinis]
MTRPELQLLICLMRHVGQVLSRDKLLNQVWVLESDVMLNADDATITLLRKKVDGPFKTKCIQSIYGAAIALLQVGNENNVQRTRTQ